MCKLCEKFDWNQSYFHQLWSAWEPVVMHMGYMIKIKLIIYGGIPKCRKKNLTPVYGLMQHAYMVTQARTHGPDWNH